MNDTKIKKQRAYTPLTFMQGLYLAIKFFTKNRLFSYAGACSFSFIFSFVPVFMMIIAILLRILHATPDTLTKVFNAVPELKRFISIDHVIYSVQNINLNSTFEIVLVISIFWMARRFFASIMDTMQCIFHIEQSRKSFITQIIIILLEALIVVAFTVTIFAYISLKTINIIPLPEVISYKIEQISSILTKQYIIQLPNILIFIAVYIAYRIGPGTKPGTLTCIYSSLLCTLSFWGTRLIIKQFLNTGNYNLIYGFLGQMIITMLNMFFFFVIFIFILQCIFVWQFFSELLLGEIYLLPKKRATGVLGEIKRILFIRPHILMAQKSNLLQFPQGKIVYTPGERDTGAFYIVSGKVSLTRNAETMYLTKGDFFGEIDCLLTGERSALVKAESDCTMVKIEPEVFKTLIEQNPDAAKKAMGQISSYFSKVYGRTGIFLL